MIRIRLATEEDTDTIVGFQLRMAIESEGIELDPETLRDGVHAVFLDPHKGKYFMAVDGDNIVGSLLITPEWSDWRNKWAMWIQSVYVEPRYRRQGVFRMMYENIKEMVSRDNQVAGLRLYVDVENKNAAEVYKAVGMDGEHYRVFEWMKK
jgi:ribosomal protein S18 acetylase RimI-like enzyme